ncbi:MAG: hypothetical protein QM478_13575 [Flavobacteriaceae bacterium]
MIKRDFFVDGICYVLKLIDVSNDIQFYIDVEKSRHIDSPVTAYDPFARFGSDPELVISRTNDLVNAGIKNFFQVKKIMIRFVEEVANRGVKHFSFGANEDRKLNIYRIIANRVAEKYGYYLYEIGSSFQFYKI